MNKQNVISSILTLLLAFLAHTLWPHSPHSITSANHEEATDLSALQTEIVLLKERLEFIDSRAIPIDDLAEQTADRFKEVMKKQLESTKTKEITEKKNPELEIDFSDPEKAMSWFEKQQKQKRDERDTTLLTMGWNEAEITELRKLEENAAIDREMAQFEMMRKNVKEKPEEMAMATTGLNPLREYMSEEQYDQFLSASKRPTGYEVKQVLTGSVASNAGLLDGDKIIRFDGERVYNQFNYMQRLAEGEIDDQITIQIERNGQIMDVTVPRRPLGINGTLMPYGF